MIESTPTILLYLHSSPLIRHCSSWTEPLDPLDTTIELSSIHKGLTRATSNNIRIDPDPETVQFQIQIQENEDRRMDDNSLSPNHRSSSTSSSSSTTHTTINNDLSLISITATPDSFSSILTTFGATILHYGGHSTLAGGMLFEDEQGTGEAREVMPEKLPELVPQPSTSTSSSPKLVRGESTSLKQIVHQVSFQFVSCEATNPLLTNACRSRRSWCSSARATAPRPARSSPISCSSLT